MIDLPKILIVDDKPENLFVLSRTLKSVNAEIIQASNGNDALLQTLNHAFALAILDIQMPDMDGYELAELIRSEEKTKDIPILLLSAVYSDEFHEFKGYQSGAVDFIRKPYNPEILIQKVNTFVELDNRRRELESLNQNLEERVRIEIEKSRAQEQLMIQQNKMAEMGQMISTIAHQWRQPLNTIGLLIQDAEDAYSFGELDEEYFRKFVKNSLDQLQLMSDTIDDFRNFYKPSRCKMVFSIKEALDAIARIVNHQLMYNEISLVKQFENTDAVFVEGYPNEFKQVIMNILHNSKDAILSRKAQGDAAGFRGEISIKCSTEANRCRIVIADNGGGIPKDKLSEIFHPHYTSKGDEKGTGIGLYLAKLIIEGKMGGELTAGNNNDGAVLTIELEQAKR